MSRTVIVANNNNDEGRRRGVIKSNFRIGARSVIPRLFRNSWPTNPPTDGLEEQYTSNKGKIMHIYIYYKWKAKFSMFSRLRHKKYKPLKIQWLLWVKLPHEVILQVGRGEDMWLMRVQTICGAVPSLTRAVALCYKFIMLETWSPEHGN